MDNIFIASKSAVRKKILNENGIKCLIEPANIDEDQKNKIISYVEKINSIIPTRGIFRYDFLLDNEDIYINEINAIPGSHALYLWQNLNKSKYELLNDIVNEALSEEINTWTTTGSDGLALKSAKDIQSKLG